MTTQIRLPFVFGLLFAAVCASANTLNFAALLTGAAEAPPNASPGTGSAFVTFDDVALTLRVDVEFSDLIGLTTASHIHAATALPGTGTAGVATQTPSFGGFPLGVTSGTYTSVFDLTALSSFSNSYITGNGGTATGARTALVNAMLDGKAYLNIHTRAYPGGEIRGFLVNVPETSATLSLFGTALLVLGTVARVRRIRDS